MYVHTFGAYFGLMTSFALNYRSNNLRLKKMETPIDHNCIYATFSTNLMLSQLPVISVDHVITGTAMLWLFWPSFNACLAVDDAAQLRAIINTYFALTSSCVTAFVLTMLTVKDNQVNIVSESHS